MTFIEEVVGWDDLNEWLYLLYQAYGDESIQTKDIIIDSLISKLERTGAIRLQKVSEED